MAMSDCSMSCCKKLRLLVTVVGVVAMAGLLALPLLGAPAGEAGERA